MPTDRRPETFPVNTRNNSLHRAFVSDNYDGEIMADDSKRETPHPVEKPMRGGAADAGEAARQSLKHDKDLNRSFPEDQPDTTGGKHHQKKENQT